LPIRQPCGFAGCQAPVSMAVPRIPDFLTTTRRGPPRDGRARRALGHGRDRFGGTWSGLERGHPHDACSRFATDVAYEHRFRPSTALAAHLPLPRPTMRSLGWSERRRPPAAGCGRSRHPCRPGGDVPGARIRSRPRWRGPVPRQPPQPHLPRAGPPRCGEHLPLEPGRVRLGGGRGGDRGSSGEGLPPEVTGQAIAVSRPCDRSRRRASGFRRSPVQRLWYASHVPGLAGRRDLPSLPPRTRERLGRGPLAEGFLSRSTSQEGPL
jgi:hypothetical protein